MIPLPSLSLKAVAALIGGLALAASLGWVMRVDHLRASYKAKLIVVTGKLSEVTQRLNGFTAEIVDMTNAALERDRAHAADVQARNESIAREVAHDYEGRIADVRARAAVLERRMRAQAAAAGGRGGEAEDLSGAGAAAFGADEEAGEPGLLATGLTMADALLCTEQAIQLDELIGWVERTAVASQPVADRVASEAVQRR